MQAATRRGAPLHKKQLIPAQQQDEALKSCPKRLIHQQHRMLCLHASAGRDVPRALEAVIGPDGRGERDYRLDRAAAYSGPAAESSAARCQWVNGCPVSCGVGSSALWTVPRVLPDELQQGDAMTE